MALIAWEGYTNDRDALQIVRWSNIKFDDELGRGKRKRKITDPYSPQPGKRSAKRKPESRAKRGEKIHEIIDLLDGNDDDKSQAEI